MPVHAGSGDPSLAERAEDLFPRLYFAALAFVSVLHPQLAHITSVAHSALVGMAPVTPLSAGRTLDAVRTVGFHQLSRLESFSARRADVLKEI